MRLVLLLAHLFPWTVPGQLVVCYDGHHRVESWYSHTGTNSPTISRNSRQADSGVVCRWRWVASVNNVETVTGLDTELELKTCPQFNSVGPRRDDHDLPHTVLKLLSMLTHWLTSNNNVRLLINSPSIGDNQNLQTTHKCQSTMY